MACTIIPLIFVLGYLLITLEHKVKINKAAIALVTGILVWTVLALFPGVQDAHSAGPGHAPAVSSLQHHLADIAEILFFLLGAMTIVELIDAHDGFSLITSRIRTRNKVSLLWILSWITFILSALLDNLTTTIVMVSILRKLIEKDEDRWLFSGMVIIAANAGGAWSPIGDVTTTMLWIGGQITAAGIIGSLILPSIVCLLVPLSVLSFKMKGTFEGQGTVMESQLLRGERNIVFFAGLMALLFVPVFKTVTHLPPYAGMLLALGAVWILTEILHKGKPLQEREPLSVVGVIRRIDTPSILFFLGILLAVAGLQAAGHLTQVAEGMQDMLANVDLIAMAIGALSAVLDNVPLVAATMGMYPITTPGMGAWADAFVTDGHFWNLLAYCTGTGGSILIIGSAAGVAAMGLERITFFWYLKKISLLALLGYLSGALLFISFSG